MTRNRLIEGCTLHEERHWWFAYGSRQYDIIEAANGFDLLRNGQFLGTLPTLQSAVKQAIRYATKEGEKR